VNRDKVQNALGRPSDQVDRKGRVVVIAPVLLSLVVRFQFPPGRLPRNGSWDLARENRE
jgi:hypothetical protein